MITSTGLDASKTQEIATKNVTKDKRVLGKDDFMKLLLVELQNQDPTEPMDSEKILNQTSQLATLESAGNTNKALDSLSKSLINSQQFATISAIGKTADLGSDAISLEKDSEAVFEIYLPNSSDHGSIEIKDSNNHTVKTIDLGKKDAGVYQYTWDGKLRSGENAEAGVYHVSATYTDQNAKEQQTRVGLYPIESMKFEDGKSLAKVGSNYVELEQIKEVF
jgi:flagellar basal-body rod modification protein FlgD